MMDLVYWSRALRNEREREAVRHQRASHARAVLRQPPAPLSSDAVRSLVFDTRRRGTPSAGCCLFGAGA